MLTAKQRELLIFIDGRLKQNGISPSFDEMREALDLKSKSGVHRLISALEERGFIRRLPNRARALEVLKVPEANAQPTGGNVTPIRQAAPVPANDTIEIPLHGRIALGAPDQQHVRLALREGQGSQQERERARPERETCSKASQRARMLLASPA